LLPQAYFEEGSTALMHAAALGHHEVVRLLVAAGANARLQDADGQSPLVHPANTASTHLVASYPIPSHPISSLISFHLV
jgi:ankyrin repeat protein